MTGNREGKCTAYSKALRMLMAVKRAVPWSQKAKNREKSCERSYFPVCSHLTREGTGSKGLMVTRMKVPGNAGHLFFILSALFQSIHANHIAYNINSSGLRNEL